MRRGSIVVLLIAFAFAAGIVQDTNPMALAQESTPAAGRPASELEGVTLSVVATSSLDVEAPGTATLSFGRITLAPGAVVPFDSLDPSAVLVYTGTGELTFRVEAPITVERRVRPGTPTAAGPETVAADTEFTMRQGDSALFPAAVAGEVWNDGDEEAAAWLINVAFLSEAASTPTP